MSQFTIDEVSPELAIIRAGNRLNMVSAPQLRETVDKAVNSGRSHVVVDLSATEFMDSSGLGALIGALKTARAAGGDLRIAAAGQQVLMVLQLSNMDRILRPYDDPATAFAG
ncbi:MAG TPA: STAS domain-containing protein [Propionicimonas sp.]|jgi:anti-sigma B factor antagonist|nr:STAS domain-containing protein [Propionicimonas sp.]